VGAHRRTHGEGKLERVPGIIPPPGKVHWRIVLAAVIGVGVAAPWDAIVRREDPRALRFVEAEGLANERLEIVLPVLLVERKRRQWSACIWSGLLSAGLGAH
jgi:hypothetical protein